MMSIMDPLCMISPDGGGGSELPGTGWRPWDCDGSPGMALSAAAEEDAILGRGEAGEAAMAEEEEDSWRSNSRSSARFLDSSSSTER